VGAHVVLGSVARSLSPETESLLSIRMTKSGATDQGLINGPATLNTFRRNIADAGLETVVE